MEPDCEAFTNAPPSPVMPDARAEAIEEVVVPDPLQLAESPWEFTVMVQFPESYTVVYTVSCPPVRVDPEYETGKEVPEKYFVAVV